MNQELINKLRELKPTLQEKYGIEISTKEILSKKRGETLSDEHYKIILECRGWLEKVESKMNVYDRSLNAILLKNRWVMRVILKIGIAVTYLFVK